MLYDIRLQISYDYDHEADTSRHVVRLLPADLPGQQRLVAGSLDIDPRPSEWTSRRDFFGNACAELAFLDIHREIRLAVQARVDRLDPSWPLDLSPLIADLRGEITDCLSVDANAPHHFAGISPRIPLNDATSNFARSVIDGSMSVLAAVQAIGSALYRYMQFEPGATTVDTPLLDAFNRRRGVCQDYAHIMIACLRGIGIPAGYVSGFLRTVPPPGEQRLEGADAMHAWIRAWCGVELGWMEYDPTNDIAAGVDHIVVARGRDYSDIAPVKGVFRSHGEHSTTHSVDVVPVGGHDRQN